MANGCIESYSFSDIKTDEFQHCFTIPYGTRTTLWKTKKELKTCGSFNLEIVQACATITIYVNNQFVTTKPVLIDVPQDGDLTYYYTTGNLKKIEVLCNDPNTTGESCEIKLCLITHYKCC